MALTERVLQFIKDNRQRIINGQINCIPSPFKRFRNDFIGIQQGFYYIVTGQTKSAKTQIANFLFLYTPILYAFKHPDKVRLKIFYFPLEETQEAIMLRFMCFLLYTLSDKKIRVSPTDLKSIKEDAPLDPSIIALLESEEYQQILKFFEERVTFIADRNPTGLFKTAVAYAETHGTTHTKIVSIKDKQGNVVEEKEVFDYYTPDDPDEYVLFFWDHASLTDQERGMNLLQSVGKLSEYNMIIRNHYHYIPVLIQQQSTETGNLEAYKAGKIRPTQAGLADNKATARDATVLLGITNPAAFEVTNSFRYDITKLKGNLRLFEVILNREGESNGVIALYFDGAVNYFEELPLPNDTMALQEFYDRIAVNKQEMKAKPFFFLRQKWVKKLKI